MSNRRDTRILFGILLIAFALRVIALNARSVWYDEAFAVFLAEQDFVQIVLGTAADTMPPLFYFLLHFWLELVGETPFALRMLTVNLSLLIVVLGYAIAKHTLGRRAGLFAAWFIALAPFQIYHAQEMRMYTLFALGSLIYLYGVMRLNARHALVAIIVGMTMALYSHNLAFATLLAANIYFLWRRNWRAQIRLLIAQLVGGLFFLPWLILVPGQIAKIQRAFWTQPPGLADAIQMLVVFTTFLPLPPVAFIAALFVSVLILVLMGIALWRIRNRPLDALGLILGFVVVPPFALFAMSYLMRPVFVPRGAIASSVAYYILLAVLAARASRVNRRIALVLAILIAGITLPFFYTTWGEWRRAPFAQADEFLRAQTMKDDLILHDNKLSFFSMRYYDRTLTQEFLADPVGTGNDTLARGSQNAMNLFPTDLNAVINGRARVWFIIFQTAIDEAEQEGHLPGNLAVLDARMNRMGATRFGDLKVIRYEAR